MMKTKLLILTVLLAVALAPSAMASGIIPYPNVGFESPSQQFTALHSGDLMAYFYGSDALFDSQIGLLVNGVSTGLFGLPNHASGYAQQLNFGPVTAGDDLDFELVVSGDGPVHSWFSHKTLNFDGINHTYATPWATDGIIPNGTYIGWEDRRANDPAIDYDYNDHQFVFTNVGVVPEPASILLFGTGLVGLGLALNRRRKGSRA